MNEEHTNEFAMNNNEEINNNQEPIITEGENTSVNTEENAA